MGPKSRIILETRNRDSKQVLSITDSYGNEKLIRKWTKSVFCFGFFQFYGNENGPDSYSQIRLSVS